MLKILYVIKDSDLVPCSKLSQNSITFEKNFAQKKHKKLYQLLNYFCFLLLFYKGEEYSQDLGVHCYWNQQITED